MTSTSPLCPHPACQVLDAGTRQWSALQLAGDEAPCGREDAAWVFDARTTSLVLFGGWSRWAALGAGVLLGCKLLVHALQLAPFACACLAAAGWATRGAWMSPA